MSNVQSKPAPKKRGRKPKVVVTDQEDIHMKLKRLENELFTIKGSQQMPDKPPELKRHNAYAPLADEEPEQDGPIERHKRKASLWAETIREYKKIPNRGSDEYAELLKLYNAKKGN